MRLNLDLQPFDRKTVSYYLPPVWGILLITLLTAAHYFYLEYSLTSSSRNISGNQESVQSEIAELTNVKVILEAKKNRLKAVQTEYDKEKSSLKKQQLSWYTLFSEIENAIPEKLFLTSINYDEESNRKFLIKGQAATLSEIISFSDQLLKSAYFSDLEIVKSEKAVLEEIKEDVYRFEISCIFLG